MASPSWPQQGLPELLSPGTLRAVARARSQAQAQAQPRRPATDHSINSLAASPSSKSALRSRPRGRRSYREWSSGEDSESLASDEDEDPEERDGDDTSAAISGSTSGSRVTRSSRRRAPLMQPFRPQNQNRHSRRRSSRVVHYAEDSHSDGLLDEEEEEDNDDDQENISAEESMQPPRAKRPRISKSASTNTSSRVTRSSRKPPVRRKIVQFQDRKPSPKPSTPPVPSDGVIPPWQTLPYDILLSIFRYALQPAHDDNFRPTANVNWLVHASRVCRAFTEPALTALYESPPLLFLDQPHDFLDLLTKEHTQLDYKLKVKRLEMDCRRTLANSSPGRGTMDIAALISRLPNLSAIDITTSLDRPPYRDISHKRRWVYPDNLFQCLRETGTRLKEWRWAGHLIGKSFAGFLEIHSQLPFLNLTHLSLSHLELLDNGDEPTISNAHLPSLALAPLHQLESLTLISCDSVRWDILNNLPNDLKVLHVLNCPLFSTEICHAHLVEHGRRLKQLVLNHCRALDLLWLVDLKTCCPNLEILRMDLTYFSSALLTQNADAEPDFEALMYPEDIPSWPENLVELEMLNLRKWSAEAAVVFFESILSSSKELARLRKLVVRAMIDISWRDRAGFREKWIGRLKDTFLSKSTPPNPHLASFRASRAWKEASERQKVEEQEKEEAKKSDTDRRQTRSAVHALDDDNNDDDDELPEENVGLGSCEVVEISIDNMRPTETRLSEADFIDSEISGDEEWTGERSSSPRHAAYAW